MDKDLHAIARFADDFNEIIRINFWRVIEPGKIELMRGDQFEVLDQAFHIPDRKYGAHIDRTAAQTLMDTLWECGIRPTAGKGSAGQLAAVQEHLQDMRVLVGKTHGVDLLRGR